MSAEGLSPIAETQLELSFCKRRAVTRGLRDMIDVVMKLLELISDDPISGSGTSTPNGSRSALAVEGPGRAPRD